MCRGACVKRVEDAGVVLVVGCMCLWGGVGGGVYVCVGWGWWWGWWGVCVCVGGGMYVCVGWGWW